MVLLAGQEEPGKQEMELGSLSDITSFVDLAANGRHKLGAIKRGSMRARGNVPVR